MTRRFCVRAGLTGRSRSIVPTRPGRSGFTRFISRKLCRWPSRRKSLARALAESHYARTRENQFLEIVYRSGKRDHLYRGDLASGAIIAAIVERAKSLAIKRAIETKMDTALARADLAARLAKRIRRKRPLPADRRHRRLAEADRFRSRQRDQARPHPPALRRVPFPRHYLTLWQGETPSSLRSRQEITFTLWLGLLAAGGVAPQSKIHEGYSPSSRLASRQNPCAIAIKVGTPRCGVRSAQRAYPTHPIALITGALLGAS